MANDVIVKQVDGFGPEFVARFRGHKVAGGVSEANLGVSCANFAMGFVGYGVMRLIKKKACAGTKFGEFSLFGFLKDGGLK